MKLLRLLLSAIVCLPVVAMGYQVREGQVDDSAYYPSTVHRYTVTIPEGYDPLQGAALYVGLDGILCNAPERIDSLIATGDIPPMIGVFIEPGIVYDDNGEVLRYNRSCEFDAPDGRFARFLEQELLPEALKDINILPGGENAMIFGLSSGGIAAFNAAWQRPDLFGRVYSGCGTFVPMRGADELQSWVRKTEPRDIKVFLQDGFSDTWNPLFGSWYEANRLLGSALEFAGYDCAFDWAEGGHSVRRSSQIFPEVMKWLWGKHDAKTTGNSTMAPYLEEAGEWISTPTTGNFEARTGAVYPGGSHVAEAVDGSNYLWQYLLRADGSRYAGQPFYWLHSMENRTLRLGGMSFDNNGNLWVVTDAGIQVCDQNGRVRAILRLPLELEKALIDNRGANPLRGSLLDIAEGEIRITTQLTTYARKLNIHPATTRPKSQGQG